ncbi:hypothetical protein RRG08_008853 [Elysia crispata]|uniref:Uncharacterized protein n=1 Tax=Elysia crispata TaxID=231223 RepID=A0AAE1AA65_9GAST|nr:hypothetical protein RRG08_008853 [Elysia crispata]
MTGRGGGGGADSGDFPTDYIDIVNEINDFIASLDAPPLSEHTKQLVGDQTKTRCPQQHPAAPYCPPGLSDAAGQKSRGFAANDNGQLGEQCDAVPRFPSQRHSSDSFGYQANVPVPGHQLATQQAGPEDPVISFGDYDNPALLVAGSTTVPKAQHRDVSRVAGQSASRSRHASGERRQPGYGENREGNSMRPPAQSSGNIAGGAYYDKPKLSLPGVASEVSPSQTFPLEESFDPSPGHYDYVDSDRLRSAGVADYSDCSSYSDTASVTSSSGGGTGDSDSGCYTHYQQPRSHVAPKPSFYKDLSHSLDSSHFLSSPSSPLFSGTKGSSAGNPALSWSRQQQPVTVSLSQRPQSPDRLSAEFRCDSDDLNFQQVGSSARTLASRQQQQQHKERAFYQQVSTPPRPLPASLYHPSPPQVPKSPVPQRRSPPRVFASRADSSPSPTESNCAREVSYSVINKNDQSPSNPPQKLNLKARWPPASASEATDAPSPGVKPSCVKGNQSIQLSKPKAFQRPSRDTGAGGGTPQWQPAPQPQPGAANTRIPDLSVLISELRSAAADSRLEQASSPTSPYKSTARSESRSQTQSPVHGPRQPVAQARSEPQSPVTRPRCAGNQADPSHRLQQPQQSPQKPGSRSAGQSPVRLKQQAAGTRLDSPDRHHDQKDSSRHCSRSRGDQPLPDGLKYKSASPDHDYEPIETLQLEVPATPRPQPKFPHPQGHTAMADSGGQGHAQTPKHVKALFNFKGANNDEGWVCTALLVACRECLGRLLTGRSGYLLDNEIFRQIHGPWSWERSNTGGGLLVGEVGSSLVQQPHDWCGVSGSATYPQIPTTDSGSRIRLLTRVPTGANQITDQGPHWRGVSGSATYPQIPTTDSCSRIRLLTRVPTGANQITDQGPHWRGVSGSATYPQIPTTHTSSRIRLLTRVPTGANQITDQGPHWRGVSGSATYPQIPTTHTSSRIRLLTRVPTGANQITDQGPHWRGVSGSATYPQIPTTDSCSRIRLLTRVPTGANQITDQGPHWRGVSGSATYPQIPTTHTSSRIRLLTRVPTGANQITDQGPHWRGVSGSATYPQIPTTDSCSRIRLLTRVPTGANQITDQGPHWRGVSGSATYPQIPTTHTSSRIRLLTRVPTGANQITDQGPHWRGVSGSATYPQIPTTDSCSRIRLLTRVPTGANQITDQGPHWRGVSGSATYPQIPTTHTSSRIRLLTRVPTGANQITDQGPHWRGVSGSATYPQIPTTDSCSRIRLLTRVPTGANQITDQGSHWRGVSGSATYPQIPTTHSCSRIRLLTRVPTGPAASRLARCTRQCESMESGRVLESSPFYRLLSSEEASARCRRSDLIRTVSLFLPDSSCVLREPC